MNAGKFSERAMQTGIALGRFYNVENFGLQVSCSTITVPGSAGMIRRIAMPSGCGIAHW